MHEKKKKKKNDWKYFLEFQTPILTASSPDKEIS